MLFAKFAIFPDLHNSLSKFLPKFSSTCKCFFSWKKSFFDVCECERLSLHCLIVLDLNCTKINFCCAWRKIQFAIDLKKEVKIEFYEGNNCQSKIVHREFVKLETLNCPMRASNWKQITNPRTGNYLLKYPQKRTWFVRQIKSWVILSKDWMS